MRRKNLRRRPQIYHNGDGALGPSTTEEGVALGVHSDFASSSVPVPALHPLRHQESSMRLLADCGNSSIKLARWRGRTRITGSVRSRRALQRVLGSAVAYDELICILAANDTNVLREWWRRPFDSWA